MRVKPWPQNHHWALEHGQGPESQFCPFWLCDFGQDT